MSQERAKKPITAALLFDSDRPLEDAFLDGAELQKVFWRVKGLLKEKARQETFWAATNQALENVNQQLAQRTQELREARAELLALNQDLERRVAEQVQEIVRRSREVDTLNIQLQLKVQERSRELAAALSQLARQPQVTLSEGDVVGERVRIVRLLGRGGMGRVYLGEDLLTKQQVALKLLLPEVVCGTEDLQRFISEAQCAAAVSHPGIVRTLHIDVTEDGTIYQIMEYVRGAPLSRRIAQGPLSPGSAARIAAAVSSALAAAHAQGIVHRDMKPANVLLSEHAPSVRLLDFGLSKMTRGNTGALDSLSLTLAGQLMGTPQYMSPEQIRDSQRVTSATDVYSLGITLFEAMVGWPPFVATDLAGICLAHLTEKPPDLSARVPEVPRDLAALVQRCLSKQATDRPTAADLATTLSQMADDLRAPDEATCAFSELMSLTQPN